MGKKYRYKIIDKKIGVRLRELIWQGYKPRKIQVLQGNVGKDRVHLLASCPLTMTPSKIVQYLKGRSSMVIQEEVEGLKKRYWVHYLCVRGYFCATVENVDEETIRRYIESQEIESENDKFEVE
ncbi:IS200/IS605 family transposase [Oceanirhabdus seepicola]|uniref:IS200/IS605 family transposase n=1 Tax=Oceanirhabdus seepicola TaxID=2828781 RepID=UPI002032B4BE|nr:IS200/IS605 family transposase [Oceanirhabdus seepicola]